MKTNHARGRGAEIKAKWILRFKGYRLLAERFKTPVGEIDLIMQRGSRIVFIEVKQRRTQTAALESLSLKQQQRIARAAQWYLSHHWKKRCPFVRFDVLALWSWRWTHLQNAWLVSENGALI